MNTRSTLNLTETPLNDLLITCKKRNEFEPAETDETKSSFIASSLLKEETISAPISSTLSTTDRSSPVACPSCTMTDTEDISELQDSQRKQAELEERFLRKIPVFKPGEDSDMNAFMSKAEAVFIQLKYVDETRLNKIRDKLDESLHTCLDRYQNKNNGSWNDFKRELMLHLNQQPSLTHPSLDTKQCFIDSTIPRNCDSKPSALDLLRRQVTPFSGEENARHWFILIDSKFSEAKMSLTDRLDLLPNFLAGDAILWFSLNKAKMQCYTDFCQLFALDYLQSKQTSDRNDLVDRKKEFQSPQSSLIINTNTPVIPHHLPHETTSTIIRHGMSSNSIISSSPALSPTISKALIDKFVKDPIRFAGGKDDVTTWIDEIEQQFNTMHLNDSDKLNLIHICLKNDAYQWYRQHKEQFTSWHNFLDEVRKTFTSNLQRDLVFDKLKHFHQTVHQSICQYYTTMIKLMKQADPQMSESTKVQYLINGLLPSLSTETRRNYPKTTTEFLEQAKRAEEITAMNSILVSNSSITDDSQPLINSSSSKSLRKTSTNDRQDHAPPPNFDHINRNDSYSSNNGDQRRYVNRISNPPSSVPYTRNQPSTDAFHSRYSSRSARPDQHSAQRQYNSDSPRNQDYPHQHSSKRHSSGCFRCGSPDHQARHCNHFDDRSQ